MRKIFDEIKRRVKLEEYLGFHYGMVVKNGMALCPLHKDEKTPSFHVISDERWYCFGCGVGGDIIEFHQRWHGLPLMESVRNLAKELNIELSKEEESRIKAFRELQDRNQRMLDRASQDLKEDMSAETYLASRQISDEALSHFGLGFRPDCNVISIPIKDRFNRLVGYSLRLITPRDDEPKYKNSRADALGLFQKKEILYNLGACRGDLKSRVYIAEGYFDVIALWQAGFKNSVGICQAIMTKEQAKILHEAIGETTEIVLVPDTDRAGIEALHKNVALLRAYSKERSIKVSLISSGKDAGEAFVTDREEFKRMILCAEQAELLILRHTLETEPDRVKQYQVAKPVVASVTPLLRDDLVTFLSESWGKDRKLLSSYFGTNSKDADPSSFSGPLDLPESYSTYLKEVHKHGIRFNIPSMDRLIRRIAPGEVCIIQARTSVGKTATLLNFLGNFSKQGIPVLFFSLEQQKEQIFERCMQISNRFTGRDVERMVMTMDSGLADAHENFYRAFKNLWVCDKGSMTLAQIKEHALQFAAINTFPFVIAIDYFGYIRSTGSSDVYEKSSALAKELKASAKEMNNCWMVLHQLSRIGGSGGEPVTLEMGRDSGVIEESADQVIGLWRPELEKDLSEEERVKREQESVLMAAVLKNRSGPTGLIKFRFDRTTLIVREYDADSGSEEQQYENEHGSPGARVQGELY